MEIVFRAPVPGDMGWVISMHGKIYAQDFQLTPQFEIDIARKLVLFFDHSDDFDQLLIALVNGDPVGSIAVSKKSATTAFVNFVLVIHEFRGQGIATKMINKVIDHARQNQFSKLRLETYSCLRGARYLYNKLGFQLVRRNLRIKKYGQVFDQEFWELIL
ncbi:MAG: GNAT family N-acetyltransferase [Cyanobacteria bacterium P01_C01_bin.118]